MVSAISNSKSFNSAEVLAELNDLEFEIAETISGRLEQMSADEQD